MVMVEVVVTKGEDSGIDYTDRSHWLPSSAIDLLRGYLYRDSNAF